MDRFWSSASRSAFYHEAFQTQFQPAKPNKDLIEKLNAVSITGPMANRSFFQELAKNVMGVTVPNLGAEGFQVTAATGTATGTTSATASLDQMLNYIDTPLTTSTPNRFQTAPATSTTADVSTYSTLSQIDQLEEFYSSAESTRNNLLTSIRDHIWSQISNYKTIVGNVTSIRSIAAGDETTVNNYIETGIKNMDEADLVTAWDTYLRAKASFLDSATTNVDKWLTDNQSLYNRLHTTYTTFRGLSSVTSISDAVVPFDSTIQAVPTLASLQANNYATVNTFFNTTNGHMRTLTDFVRNKLSTWEDAYNQTYQTLRSKITSIPEYTDQILTNSTAEQLITLMNEFGGIEVTGPVPSPAPAPTALITQLITGTYQEKAISTVRAFYRLLVENILVFTSSTEITENMDVISASQKSYTYLTKTVQSDASLTTDLKTLIGTMTSTNQALRARLGMSDLTTNDQKAIANVRARYEAGTLALFEKVKTAMNARLDEYKALHDMSGAFATITGIPTNTVGADKATITGLTYDVQGTLPQLRYRYFITDYKALVSAFQGVYKTLRGENEALRRDDTILATKPDLPTVTTPTFSGVNPTTTFTLSDYQMKAPTAFNTATTTIVPDIDSADFSTFFDTYFNSTNASNNATVSALFDIRIMANLLTGSIRNELVYRHELAFKIFKQMYTTLGNTTYGFNSGAAADVVAEAAKTWTAPTSTTTAAQLKTEYDTFVGKRTTYNSFIQGKVNPALTAYDSLLQNYAAFRRSAMRLNADGTPAPSSFYKNTELIDSDVLALPAKFVTRPTTTDTLTGKSGTDYNNILYSLAVKYGRDGVAMRYETGASGASSENLLPQLIDFTKGEVSEYISNYKTRFVSLAPSTQTLSSSTTADADIAALAPTAVAASTIVSSMSSYGTFTTGMLESVDRDAVIDKMLEFNDAYTYNQNVMETEGATTYGALRTRFAFTATTPDTSSQIATKFSQDTTTITSGSYSVTTITSTYNLYDQALEAMRSALIADLSGVKQNILTLAGNYNAICRTYADFSGNTLSEIGDPTNTLSEVTSTMDIAAIKAANDDILVQQTNDVVINIQSRLSDFYTTVLTSKFGSAPYSNITGKPSLSTYLSEDNVQTITRTDIPTISRSNPTQTFFANCRLHSLLLVALNTCVTNINNYLIELKTAYKQHIKNKITNFLSKYDQDLRGALKEAGPQNENYLAANIVCVTPSTTPATERTSLRCADGTTSLANENYKTQVRTTYEAGYPYTDYQALDSDSSHTITLSDLEGYDSKYDGLVREVTSLRGKLLGIKEVRRDALGYISNYYNLYNQYKTYIDAIRTSTAFATFNSDVSGAAVYYTQIRNSNYSVVSDAYNDLTEAELRSTFLPYATASTDPVRAEGAKYRNLLTVFAAAVIHIIDGFINDRNSPDNHDALAARTLIAELADISYTAADKQELAGPTITLSRIVELLYKYVTNGSTQGLISKLSEALSSGTTSKNKRLAAIDAMNKYLGVYDSFKVNLFNSNTLYGSNKLTGAVQTRLRKINDVSNSVFYLTSTGSTTSDFRALDDAGLDGVAQEYYDNLPVTSTFNAASSPSPSPSNTSPANYTASYTGTSADDTLIGLIKKTLRDVMDTFETDYNNSGDATYGMGSNFWDSTVLPFVQSDFRNVANMVATDKAAVDAATNETGLQNYVDKYLVLDTANDKKGLTLVLGNEVNKVKNIKDTRASALTAIQTYVGIYTLFPTLLTNYTSDELTFINTYYDISQQTVTSAFYTLNVGAVGDVLVFSGTSTNTLNGIITHFDGQTGQGIVNIYNEVKIQLNGVIDSYKQTYEGTTLFSSALATTQRVSAPSAFYKDSVEFNRRVQADKTATDTAATQKDSNALLALYGKYVEPVTGYQKELSDLISILTSTKNVREAARSSLITYYNMQKEFVGQKTTPEGTRYTSVLDNNKANITGIVNMNVYIELDTSGNIQVTDAFYAQSNELVQSIESNYNTLTNTSSSINLVPYTLEYSETSPNLTTTPLINIIRFYIFKHIKGVNTFYVSNSDLLTLEGVVLDPKIASATFNDAVTTDIGAIHSASLTELKALEEKYVELNNIIRTTVGPLGLTKLLRPIATNAAIAYLNLYDSYAPFTDISGTSVYTAMKNDYDALTSIFTRNNPTCTLRTTTDNNFLECSRKKYVNKYDETIIDGATCNDTTINIDSNAYVRLLKACRELVKDKIDKCANYYRTNTTTIEENGVSSLPIGIQYIIYPKPPSTMTEPQIDKAYLDAGTHEQLWGQNGRINEMRNKYYVGASSIENLIRGAILGGGALGDARRDLNSAIESMRRLYNEFNIKLFASAQNNYRQFIGTNTSKYIGLMGPGTDRDAYIKTENGTNVSTSKFRSITVISELQSEKTVFEYMLGSETNDTLFKAVQKALVQLFTDYNTKWNTPATVALFADVLSPLTAGWDVNREYPTLNPLRTNGTSKITEDIATINSQTNLTDALELFKEKQTEYLDQLFSNLTNAITDATQAQYRYKCRDEMIRLDSLFRKNQGILKPSDKPAELTTAESYYISTKTYSDSFKALTNTELDTKKGEMTTAYTSLLATVKTRLSNLLTSYKGLREKFFAFYDENKEELGTVSEIDSLDRAALLQKDNDSITSLGRQSTTAAEVDGIRDYYLAPAGTSNYETMIQIIQAYFDGGANAIDKYTDRFSKVFDSSKITIVTEAPFAYAAPTAAEERGRLTTATAPDELANLVTRYDTRYDYIRITEARKKVAIAIVNYWMAIPLGTAEMQMTETSSALFARSKSYIENLDLPENQRGSTFPFKQSFYDINNEVTYATMEGEFKTAESRFLESLRSQYEKEVTEFYNKIWVAYNKMDVPPDMVVPVEHIGVARQLSEFIKDSDRGITEAVDSIIRNDGVFPTKTTFAQMQKFVKDMKLFITSQDYMRCITTDIAARNQSNPIRYLFDKPKPFLPEPFQTAQQPQRAPTQISQPQRAPTQIPQSQPQPRALATTAPTQAPAGPYAPFQPFQASSHIPSASDPFAQFRPQQPQQSQQLQQPQPQPPNDLFSAKGGTSRWASF